VSEFYEMVKRHGVTPVQWAHSLGLCRPGTVLGHALFIDEHSWLHWWSRKDVGILADTGTTVAHCPTPFARYGQTLESFGRYRRAGVNLGMGTDTVPQNMLEEIRWATVLGRIAAEDIKSLDMADVFHAADRAVRDVYVDGTAVVRDGRVLTLDRAGALERLKEGQARKQKDAPSRDYMPRRADEIATLTFPVHS
jgi:cytosine/adenosine deaminase-related metal-dependent hydrolase